MIVRGSGYGKNVFLNLINHEPDIDEIYLYAKDQYESIYQLLINKGETAALKYLNDSKAFNKWKIMIVFDFMIADILCNKRVNPTVTELFIRGRKLNIYLVFVTQSCFAVPKNIRLNFTHYFIIKIPNKQKLAFIRYWL